MTDNPIMVDPSMDNGSDAAGIAFENVLASGSPRRRELLSEKGVRFRIFSADADEELTDEEASNPRAASELLAERKALASIDALRSAGQLGACRVIAADTMVVLDDVIFGKPTSAADACEMLGKLSGRTHQVITGVSVWTVEPFKADLCGAGCNCGDAAVAAAKNSAWSTSHESFHVASDVTFRSLTADEIRAYVETGEPMDKAGAYGIQGKGGALVERFDGSWSNIVGLPVEELLERHSELLD